MDRGKEASFPGSSQLFIVTCWKSRFQTYFSDLEGVRFLLLSDVLHDERVEGRVSTRDEGVVVPHVADLSNPVVVQLAHTVHRDEGGVVIQSL